MDTCLAAGFFHPNDDLAFLDHSAGKDRVAQALVGGQGFAGHGGLVHHGLALGHHAVHRDGVAHGDDGQIAGHDFRGGHAHRTVLAAHPDGVEGGGQGLGQTVAGTFAGVTFEHLAKPQQQGDARGRTVVLAGDGHADGQGVEDLDVELAARQRA